MQKLPTSVQDFGKIRTQNYLYVDKTEKLLQMVENGESYFLSRPRRFGKSLTLSTLEAMFQGKVELFKGLYAEKWVKEQAKHPNPVIKLDIATLGYKNVDLFNEYLVKNLENFLFINKFDVPSEKKANIFLSNIITRLYDKFGPVVLLIDEYRMTDKINNLEKPNEMREYLRSFSLKTCSQYLRFVMVTGVSKFSKAGVFSGLNNLEDISSDKYFGDIVGYTQQELEDNFGEWIENTEKELSMDREELLDKIKEYYCGFSFDGETNVYNSFSLLNFFKKSDFRNYWFLSGSPSSFYNYLQHNNIKNPDKYEGITVPKNFTDRWGIESTSIENFLYQAGYLTIKKKVRNELVLGYPNEEIRSSLAEIYLSDFYHIEDYLTLGNEIWKALEDDNIENLVKSFNLAILEIPMDIFASFNEEKKCDDFGESKDSDGYVQEYLNQRKEHWYRTILVMLLRGAGAIYYAKVHTFRDRSDVVIIFKNKLIIVKFKLAKNLSELEIKKKEGLEQILLRDYSSLYIQNNKKVINFVLVVDDEKGRIVV